MELTEVVGASEQSRDTNMPGSKAQSTMSEATQRSGEQTTTNMLAGDEATAPSDSRRDPEDLMLQVLDVSFDGKEPKMLLRLYKNDDIEAALQNLAPHRNGVARVFDLHERRITQNGLPAHLKTTYPDFQDTNVFFDRTSTCDLWTISRQWIGNTMDPCFITIQTTLWGAGRLQTGNSSLRCWNLHDNKLLVMSLDNMSWVETVRCRSPTVFGCLLSGNGLTNMANGTHDQFAKLIVLDFLASSVFLSPTSQLEPWQDFWTVDPIAFWPEVTVVLGIESKTPQRVDDFVEHLRLCETVLQELQVLVEAIDFVAESVRKNFDHMERAANPQLAANGSDERLDERIFVLQQHCHQRQNNADRYIQRLNRAFEGQNKILNI